MGLAGSGKGTQGEMLAVKLGYSYFSTGHFLRSYMTEERKAEMLKGKLLQDKEIIEIIEAYFSKLKDKNKTILDGFPRTVSQAETLMSYQPKWKTKIEGLIFLDVPEDELINRLIKRARPDDTKPAIKKRFHEYIKQTAPVLEFFENMGIKIHKIKGDQPVEAVQRDIIVSINNSKQP